jgi:hypothetical protein
MRSGSGRPTPPAEPRRAQPWKRAVGSVVFLAFLALVAAFAWVAALVLYGIILGSIAIHEFGHVFASWTMGVRVVRIEIGGGPALEFSVGGTRVHLGLIPLWGVTVPEERPAREWTVRRYVWLFAGGVVAQMMLVGAAIVLLPQGSVVVTIVVVNAWLIVANLFPDERPMPGGTLRSDGSMLRLVRQWNKDVNKLDRYVRAGNFEFARRTVQDLARRHPETSDQLEIHLAYFDFAEGDLDAALARLAHVDTEAHPELLVDCLSISATAKLWLGEAEVRHSGVDDARRAYDLAPDRKDICHTWCDALVVAGQPDAALALVDATGPTDTDSGAREAFTITRANVLIALGRTEEAVTALDTIASSSPFICRYRDRLRREAVEGR